MKIDHRKSYYLTIDTETANTFDDPMVYDLGGCIHDKKGNVYETFSFVIAEVFYGMQDLMESAYYAEKIPTYREEIRMGERRVVPLVRAKIIVRDLCEKYNVKAIIAHNMAFDYRALSKTQRYLTKSKYRWFFPYGIELWDSLKMAQDTICKQKGYIAYCEENGFVTKYGKPRATAEILTRYLEGKIDYQEEHTGLADVLIEKEITAQCFRQHKAMRKKCFK